MSVWRAPSLRPLREWRARTREMILFRIIIRGSGRRHVGRGFRWLCAKSTDHVFFCVCVEVIDDWATSKKTHSCPANDVRCVKYIIVYELIRNVGNFEKQYARGSRRANYLETTPEYTDNCSCVSVYLQRRHRSTLSSSHCASDMAVKAYIQCMYACVCGSKVQHNYFRTLPLR